MVNRWHLKCAARVVRQGGVVAYPTESVYGLGCDPANFSAVMKLLAVKNRPVEKGLILIAADFHQIQPYMAALDKSILDRMMETWPGPVTWLVPAHPHVPSWLRGEHSSIAVRITAHPLAAALCTMLDDALVSTSANIHRQAVARTALRVRSIFASTIDYILPGQIGRSTKPTEIRDALTNKIVRSA